MKRNAAGIAYEQLPEMSGFAFPLWLVNFTKKDEELSVYSNLCSSHLRVLQSVYAENSTQFTQSHYAFSA